MLGTTISKRLFFVYVLESFQDRKRYIGYTQDLRRRVAEHNSGKSFATNPRLPFELIYFEACTNQNDALRRERYFKKLRAEGILQSV